MRLCFVVFVSLFVVACGDSTSRGEKDFTPERVHSDAGLAGSDATPTDADQADATIPVVDANAEVDVDATLDAEPITPDARPEVDASLADATPAPDAQLPEEDAEPDSPDAALADASRVADASQEDSLPPDSSVIPDAEPPELDAMSILDAAPSPDAEPVDGGDPEFPTPELCPNAGVRLENITPSAEFPGQLTVSLDYDNWQGVICFDGECFEGILDDPQEGGYPTGLLTPRYNLEWHYMPAGQITNTLLVYDAVTGEPVVEIVGIMGPAGSMRNPGTYDDHGRHFTGPGEVNHPDAEVTEFKMSWGPFLTIFAPCRPVRIIIV